ncbi:hypothetical protein [Streptomyces sp. NPDC003710]
MTVPQGVVRYGRCAAEVILKGDLKRLLSLADEAVQWCEQARDDVFSDLGV